MIITNVPHPPLTHVLMRIVGAGLTAPIIVLAAVVLTLIITVAIAITGERM